MARSNAPRRFDGDFAISDRDFQSSDVLRRRSDLSQRPVNSLSYSQSRLGSQPGANPVASTGTAFQRRNLAGMGRSTSLQEQRADRHSERTFTRWDRRSRSRSRSKSVGRGGSSSNAVSTPRRRRSAVPQVSQFYTLGRQENTTNSYKACFRESSTLHSRNSSTPASAPTAVATRTRSKSKSREHRSSSRSRAEPSAHVTPTTTSGFNAVGTAPVSRLHASVSSSNLSTSSSVSSSPAPPVDLQSDIEFKIQQLQQCQQELTVLKETLEKTQELVNGKMYEIEDLQLQLESLQKRHRLFLKRKPQQGTFSDDHSSVQVKDQIMLSSSSDDEMLTPKRKRSRAVVEDVDGDDDEPEEVGVPLLVPRVSTVATGTGMAVATSHVSRSTVQDEPRVHVGTPKKPTSTSAPATAVRTSSTVFKSKSKTPSHDDANDSDVSAGGENVDVPDYFWGKSRQPKLLTQPKIQTFDDQSAKKLRNLAFNPTRPDVFVTGSDDGGLALWNYTRKTQNVAHVVGFDATTLRPEAPCAEDVVWSPDGARLAIAFRDPVSGNGEFCVVRLHQMSLQSENAQFGSKNKSPRKGPGGSPVMVKIPSDRIVRKTSQLHPKGINCVQWMGNNDGTLQTRGLVTAGSDTVVLWEDAKDDLTWRRVLHREHRSEVRSLCVHSSGSQVYSGGQDGLVLQYDCKALCTVPILQRRKPSIWKVNSVLEHPHNPHLLLISCIDSNEQQLLLHDLRQGDKQNSMTLGWLKPRETRSMSAYIVPRWSSAGMHVSCGSTSGMVHIWDVRARGPKFPYVSPHQSLEMHKKQVMHATWHARYNALFTISNDRTIGLASFK